MEWKIVSLECYPEHEGQENVVTIAHWTLTEGEAHVYGSVGFTLDPEAEFIPYADLTEAQVVEWVKGALGEEQVAAHEAAIAAQLEAIANPPVVKPALPW